MSLWFQFAAACFGLVAALCGLVREHGRGRLLTSCQPGSKRERKERAELPIFPSRKPTPTNI